MALNESKVAGEKALASEHGRFIAGLNISRQVPLGYDTPSFGFQFKSVPDSLVGAVLEAEWRFQRTPLIKAIRHRPADAQLSALMDGLEYQADYELVRDSFAGAGRKGRK